MPSNAVIFGVSLVYFLAFSSFFIQLPGLAGDDGIQPIRLLNLPAPKSLQDFVEGIPSLVRFKDYLHLSAYHCTEALIVLGMIVSFLTVISPTLRSTLSLLVLWLCYFSVVKVVAAFSGWRWCMLLTEAGFLCILMSIKLRKCQSAPSASIVLWLMKWLLFRILFSNAYTKLTDKNSDWWKLSAMNTYLETQLSPTPIAYYLAVFPSWVLKLASVVVLSLELFLPFLFLVPLRGVQIFSFVMHFLLQFNMLLCGNYGFLHILMLVLSFSLIPQPKKQCKKGFGTRCLAHLFVTLAFIGFVLYVVAHVFSFQVVGSTIVSKFAITYEQFHSLGREVLLYTVPVAAGLFVLAVLCSLYTAASSHGCCNKFLDVTGVFLTAFLATGLFLASVRDINMLSGSISNRFLPVPAYLHGLRSLNLVNDYRYMHPSDHKMLYKGDKEGRTTLVLEASMSAMGPWREINFFHAPSKLNRMPAIIPGHMPTLDFELVLASDVEFKKSPFLANLVYRILTQQTDVLELMEPTGFLKPPSFIRIQRYAYKFTAPNVGDWWKRTLKSTVLPPTDINNADLKSIVASTLHIGKRREGPPAPTHVSSSLDQLRAWIGQPRDLTPFYGVLAVVYLLNKIFF